VRHDACSLPECGVVRHTLCSRLHGRFLGDNGSSTWVIAHANERHAREESYQTILDHFVHATPQIPAAQPPKLEQPAVVKKPEDAAQEVGPGGT
jgi:hypothetical protein